MQTRQRHNTDRKKSKGNGSRYNERKPWVLRHTQTEKRCREQSLPSNLFPFSLSHTHRQLITAGKPRRCAGSFCPGFTSAKRWIEHCTFSSSTTALFCLKWFFQWVCPCASICFPLPCCHTWHSASVCGFPCVCVHACLYRRQGHPSQTVPSASSSLVYLSLDQRAAAACPQVSKQPALRMSWEEQEERRVGGGVFILSSSGDKSFFTQTPNFHTFRSSHAVYSWLWSHPFRLTIFPHPSPLSHSGLI